MSEYLKAFLDGFRPVEKLTVSEWADKYRVLSQKASAEYGPWRTSRVPYLKEPMDCLSEASPIEKIVLMFAAQSAKTELILNYLGYVIHTNPGPTMLVEPTNVICIRESKNRITPMLDESPALHGKIHSTRMRDTGDTISEKEFKGGFLLLTGANSPVGLAGAPIKSVCLDEVDRYPYNVGAEGNPITITEQRTSNFKGRKIIITSTPTIKGVSRVEEEFLKSDRRYFWVPCPSCGEYQKLEWKTGDEFNIKWLNEDRRQAYYECRFCHYHIQNYEKSKMLPLGEWRPEAEGDGLTAGFQLSALYHPHGWASFSDIAVAHGLAYKDPFTLRVFVNLKLGEPFDVEMLRLSSNELMKRCEDYGPDLPAGVILLTAGVDIQDSRIEVEILGHGEQGETWNIDYYVIQGDPDRAEVWKSLDDIIIHKKYRHARGVPDLMVRATAIDTGGHRTIPTYDYCRQREKNRVWAVKGRGGSGVAVWPRKPTMSNAGKVPLYIIGVDAIKEIVHSRLRVKKAGPGYCHFPKVWGAKPNVRVVDESYFEQMTSEYPVKSFHRGYPQVKWEKPSNARNEAFDCRVYAVSALQGLVSMGLSISTEATKMKASPLRGSNEPVSGIKRRKTKPLVKSAWLSN